MLDRDAAACDVPETVPASQRGVPEKVDEDGEGERNLVLVVVVDRVRLELPAEGAGGGRVPPPPARFERVDGLGRDGAVALRMEGAGDDGNGNGNGMAVVVVIVLAGVVAVVALFGALLAVLDVVVVVDERGSSTSESLDVMRVMHRARGCGGESEVEWCWQASKCLAAVLTSNALSPPTAPHMCHTIYTDIGAPRRPRMPLCATSNTTGHRFLGAGY